MDGPVRNDVAPGADMRPGEVDARDAQTDAPEMACSGSFVRPLMDAVLLAQDDADGDACALGFQYDVQVATAAPNGTVVTLFAGASQVAQGTVSGNSVSFARVSLPPQGAVVLRAQIGTASCQVSTTVTVNCMQPTCSIASPTISPMHPALNGVPAPAGDRASAVGSDFQAAFQVNTNIEDGQPVALEVAPAATPTVITRLTAVAMAGKATFAGVTLRPDGTYQVQALCTNRATVVGRSALATIPVDTSAPTLTVVSPTEGRHYNPADLMAGKFNVCVTTTSMDAVNVPASVASMGNNLRATVGSETQSGKVVNGSDGSACVAVGCPGGLPFDVEVTLTDAAGNPTTRTITGVTCASSLPSVQIVSPLGDVAPFSDVSKRLLAATSAVGIKDLDPARTGAQADVVACTDRMGAKARLFAGPANGTLTMLAQEVTVVAAQPADNCPTGSGFVARWSAVTLPESIEDDSDALVSATRLRVDVTDLSTASNSSGPADIWVDSAPPTLQPFMPNPLCGASFVQASGPYVTDVVLVASTMGVVLKVTANSMTTTYDAPTATATTVRFAGVPFEQGQNDVAVTIQEPSGNVSAFPPACRVTVGNPPVVTITAPAAGVTALCASTTVGACAPDADGVTAGWQGALTANVSIAGVPVMAGTVTFSTPAGEIGVATLDAAGNATLPAATIPEGAAVVVTATTSDLGTSGVGVASRTFTVATAGPPVLAALDATVKDRRQTSYRLSWTAPVTTGGLAGYDVRVSRTAFTDDASFAAAQAVNYTGSPAAAGSPDGIDVTGLLIEVPYFFAVRPVDAAGNVGPIITAAPAAATFNQTILTRPAGGLATERFGYRTDGTDLNGDGFSDLLVATLVSNRAYIYFGTANGYADAPSVVISGAVSGYGQGAVVAGDLDGDTFPEVAVSTTTRGSGAVDIFKGRAIWPATLTEAQADYVITADPTYAGTGFGGDVVRLGDFDADGIDDLGITAAGYNATAGRVLIVRGANPFTSVDLSLPASAARVITIDGPPAGRLGLGLTSLGRFYPAPAGNTIVVGAPFFGGGRVYAFAGQPAAGGSIALASANATLDGVGTERLGINLAPLGGLGASPNALGIGVNTPTNGRATITAGDATTGPFAGKVVSVTDPTSGSFGFLVFGGSLSGTNVSFSYLGGPEPDVVMAPINGTFIRILDGSRFATLPANVDAAAVPGGADVTLTLPTAWGSVSGRNGALRRSNDDTYPDFVLGEVPIPPATGRLVIYW